MEEFWHSIIALLLFIAALQVSATGERAVIKLVADKQMACQDKVLYEKEDAVFSYCVSGADLWNRLIYGSTMDIEISRLDGSVIAIGAGKGCDEIMSAEELGIESEYCLDYGYDNKGDVRILRFKEIAVE